MLLQFDNQSWNTNHRQQETMRVRQERYLSYQKRLPLHGPGEGGEPVILRDDELDKAEKTIKEMSINVVASEKISMDRHIPDFRSKE